MNPADVDVFDGIAAQIADNRPVLQLDRTLMSADFMALQDGQYRWHQEQQHDNNPIAFEVE